MNSWSSGSWKIRPTRARRSRTSSWPTRSPATSSSPLPGQQRVEVQHQRRLAGAVGAEHGDALAVGDVQVEPVEAGHPVGVGEAQVAGVDGAAHMRTRIARRGRGQGGEEERVGAGEGERVQARHRLAPAAGEHRQVHALGALVGAQEQRGGDAADRLRLQRVPRRVPAGGERGPHALDLVDDREQVAVHERRDQDRAASAPAGARARAGRPGSSSSRRAGPR